jgi:hypothetical protein
VTLRERAGAVPPRPDLAGAAIRQAHGIRRRRRIAGGVAAAALVALAVPLGLQAGDALRGNAPLPPATQGPERPDDEREEQVEITPSQVTVQLPELPAGDAPALPYVDGSQLIIDGDTIDLGATSDVAQVAYAGGTVWFTERDAESGELTLRSTSKQAASISVTGGPWASPDGRYLAYVADGSLFAVVTDAEGGGAGEGTEELVLGPDETATWVTFVGDDLFYSTGSDPTLMRWTIGEPGARPVDGVERATAVSPDGELVADQYKVDELKAEACTRMKSLDSRDVLWETCEFRILGFSPSGRYAWGAQAYADAEDTFNVVLDTRTGEVLMRVDGPDPTTSTQALFLGSVFESDTSLLITMAQGENAALVRCDLLSGSCERATELADGVVPFEGGLPYRLLS